MAHKVRRIIAISGDREWPEDQEGEHAKRVEDIIVEEFKADYNVLVVLGDARGVDKIARRVCGKHGISCVVERAHWHIFSGGAGPERNGRMLSHEPQKVYAFHNSLLGSAGTKNCVRQAQDLGTEVELVTLKSRKPNFELKGK